MKSTIEFINNNITPNNQNEALSALEELLLYKETVELLYSCGLISANLGNFNKSLHYYTKVLEINPNHKQTLFDLGALNSHIGDFDNSIHYANRLIEIDPEYNNILMHLANMHSNMGNHNLSIENFKKALQINPYNLNLWGDLFLSLNYINLSIEERILIRNKFSELLPHVKHNSIIKKTNKIKLGYISSDFRNHAVSYFTKGLITKHSKDKFEVFFYSVSGIEDDITEQFKSNGKYQNCSKMNTEELNNLIKHDGIDILIDLNGFTQSNRIEVFLQTPSPIQITWLGFLNSLGIPQIQYKITDKNLVDENLENYYSEKLISLKNSLIYDPPIKYPDISELPYYKNGYVTFGFFNNTKKLNTNVFDTWLEIFKNHKNCKLMIIRSKYEKYNDFIKSYFSSKGFYDIEFKDEVGLYQLMDYMGQVDVALDPFPHSGGATTGHCLWMGVPVLTLEGDLEFERISSAILKNVGLNDFVSNEQLEYTQKGSHLNFDRLQDIRMNIRKRFPDPTRVIKDLEDKLILIYDSHCQ